jgi:conjugative transfer pilus assembly protein TraH
MTRQNKARPITALILLASIISNNSYAGGVQESIASVWQSMGGESVSNSPRFYQGQKGGHLSLGSMYLGKQKKNRPLISVNYPEIDLSASCYNQGVLNFGGISFISADELKNKLTSIASQAGMMFAYMGLSSVSPVISETLQEVYSKLQELGGFLADECQVAKQIVSFAGDKMSQHSEKAKDIATNNRLNKGKDDDLSAAYKNFPNGKNEALKEKADKDERYILEDINLAWKAMEKLKIKDKRLKEKMMTISGTIIIKAAKSDKDQPIFQYISSKVTNADVLETLLKGGSSMVLLTCAEEIKCLDTSETEEKIGEKEAFQYHVSQLFTKIKEALVEDKELEGQEQTLLAKTGMPSYAIYDLLYQFTNGNPEYEEGIFIEMVAWNLLYNYLSDILKEVNEAASNLQIAASDELKEFRASLKAAQEMLGNHEMKDLSRYKLQLFMVKRAEHMEEIMAGEMSQLIGMSKSSF